MLDFEGVGEAVEQPRSNVVVLAEFRRARVSQEPAADTTERSWVREAPRALSAAAVAHRERMLRHLTGA